jgi:nitroimidazol reductase NimA-like FMN-containing flavoprotein (pyridoxamine 5'-phosphate oxidase superfamily)
VVIAGDRLLKELPVARRNFAGLPTTHVATTSPDGGPHVVPLWFVWRDDAVYVSSRRPSRTWMNLELDPRAALSFDVGRTWAELRGITVTGQVELRNAEDPTLRAVMSAWYEKYRSLLPGEGFQRLTEQVEELGFAVVRPEQLVVWNHAT